MLCKTLKEEKLPEDWFTIFKNIPILNSLEINYILIKTIIKRTRKIFKIDQYKEFVDKWLLSDIENKVGYFRRNFFVPILEAPSILECNKHLFRLCDTDNERIHY